MNAPAPFNVGSYGNERVKLQVDRCWGEQKFAINKLEGDASR